MPDYGMNGISFSIFSGKLKGRFSQWYDLELILTHRTDDVVNILMVISHCYCDRFTVKQTFSAYTIAIYFFSLCGVDCGYYDSLIATQSFWKSSWKSSL